MTSLTDDITAAVRDDLALLILTANVTLDEFQRAEKGIVDAVAHRAASVVSARAEALAARWWKLRELERSRDDRDGFSNGLSTAYRDCADELLSAFIDPKETNGEQ